MTHQPSPAPWRYVPKSGQIVDANNRQICRIWHTSNHERDQANGELIASAAMWHQVFGHLGTPDEAGNAVIAARDELQAALAMCVEAIDTLLRVVDTGQLPGAQHIPCDVGLINQALINARPLLEKPRT